MLSTTCPKLLDRSRTKPTAASQPITVVVLRTVVRPQYASYSTPRNSTPYATSSVRCSSRSIENRLSSLHRESGRRIFKVATDSERLLYTSSGVGGNTPAPDCNTPTSGEDHPSRRWTGWIVDCNGQRCSPTETRDNTPVSGNGLCWADRQRC